MNRAEGTRVMKPDCFWTLQELDLISKFSILAIYLASAYFLENIETFYRESAPKFFSNLLKISLNIYLTITK